MGERPHSCERIIVGGHAYVPAAEVADLQQEIASLRQQLALSQAREAEAYERAASLDVPVYSYDVAGVKTGIERYRKTIRALAGKEG